MNTNVQIVVPAFGGCFTCTIEKQEWSSFIQTILNLVSSVGKDTDASWGNMEENIEFRFKLHARGAIEAEYKFSPENFSLGPTLSGTFEADQSFLQGWLSSAQEVLENVR